MTNEHTNNTIQRNEIAGFTRIAETGNYAVDCATGRQVADSLMIRMAETEYTPALGEIVREMMKVGRWEAVHIGFFQRFADRSIQGAT
jgi:uncharacterized protein YllA (UPF0747 family)